MRSRYRLDRRLVGPRIGLKGLERRKSCPNRDSNSGPSAVQHVASHCTYCAIPATTSHHVYSSIVLTVVIFINTNMARSRNCSVGIETGYALDGHGSIPGRVKNFFLLQSVQTVSVANWGSYIMDAMSSFPRCKAAGEWSWPLTSF
jgi:hypothetical protein